MHVKKMWTWKEWDDAAETTLDLHYEISRLGLIPLSCRKILSPNGRECTAKVFDAPQTEIGKSGIVYRKVQCLLCGREDWRKVGLRKKRE